MGFLENVKKAAKKAKLQGELVLMDREIQAQKNALGRQLFPILLQWSLEQDNPHVHNSFTEEDEDGNDNNTNAATVHPTLPPTVAAVFQASKDDVMEYVQLKETYERQVDDIEAQRLDGSNADDNSSTKKPMSWISATATTAKLRAQITFYDREIHVRQEIFGLQLFDELDLMNKDPPALSEPPEGASVLTQVREAVLEIQGRQRATRQALEQVDLVGNNDEPVPESFQRDRAASQDDVMVGNDSAEASQNDDML